MHEAKILSKTLGFWGWVKHNDFPNPMFQMFSGFFFGPPSSPIREVGLSGSALPCFFFGGRGEGGIT